MSFCTRESDCDRRLREENSRLESELVEQRYQDDRRQEQERSDREEARRERQREAAEAMCHAETWEEAFRKGLSRFRQEAREETSDNYHVRQHLAKHPEDAQGGTWEETSYFQEMPAKVEQMQAIYNEEMATVEEQIAKLRADARNRAADRVAQIPEMDCYAEGLREDNPECLTYW